MNMRKFGVDHLQFLIKNIPVDYKSYWDNKYKKDGFNNQYVGDANIKHLKEVFINLNKLFYILKLNKDIKILDIGCGVGIFAEYLKNKNFTNYTGIDLQKDIIKNVSMKFPDYSFMQHDIITDKLTEKYDMIIMFSVTQHIVLDSNFNKAMINVKNALNENGLFLVNDRLIDRREAMIQRYRSIDHYRILNMRLLMVNDYLESNNKKLMVFKNDAS